MAKGKREIPRGISGCSGVRTPREVQGREASGASVRASPSRSSSSGRYGESSGTAREDRTFHGHTFWVECRKSRFEIRLETGRNTLAKRRRK